MGSENQLNRRSFLAGLGYMIAAFSIPDLGFTVQPHRAPDPGDRTRRFADIDDNMIFDVCIIGSGFAGAILGNALVKHGIRTVILESGPDPREQSIDPRFQQLDILRSSGPIDYPVMNAHFRGVGGTSGLWGGMCTRLHPSDFENNSYAPAGASWPITYADLEPYYERAETALRVRGGKQTDFHPPRRIDYLFPPDRDVGPVESLLQKVGISVSDIPFSTSEHAHPSILNGRYGPFVRMTESYLPGFQASPYAALIPEVTVTRLLVDEPGCIRGAEVRDLDRNVKIVRARIYVVACGGLESPRLLQLSRSPGFPNGIGNNHDLVGRYFMEHRPVSYSGRD